MNTNRRIKSFLITGVVSCCFLLIGCNHLLYQPTRVIYVNTKKLKFPPEEIKVNSNNGQKLIGWLFRGNNLSESSRPRPTILYFHGNGQNLSAHFLGLYWILEKGFDFLIFDYPGYGGSEGEPNQANTVESGHLFYNWLKENKPGPILIFGQSLGGAVALQVSQQLQGDKDLCMVAVDSTFASYKEAAASTLSQQWFTWPLQWLGYLVISDEQAPENNISKISPTPVLVIHGKKDQIISHELGERVFDLAEQPKQFYSVENGRHIENFSDRNQGAELRELFISQIRKYCENPKQGE